MWETINTCWNVYFEVQTVLTRKEKCVEYITELLLSNEPKITRGSLPNSFFSTDGMRQSKREYLVVSHPVDQSEDKNLKILVLKLNL